MIAKIFQESKMFHQTMFLWLKIDIYTITSKGHICLTQAITLSSTCTGIFIIYHWQPRFAITCKVQIIKFLLLSSPSLTLMDLSRNKGFLQWVQNVTSVLINVSVVIGWFGSMLSIIKMKTWKFNEIFFSW